MKKSGAQVKFNFGVLSAADFWLRIVLALIKEVSYVDFWDWGNKPAILWNRRALVIRRKFVF